MENKILKKNNISKFIDYTYSKLPRSNIYDIEIPLHSRFFYSGYGEILFDGIDTLLNSIEIDSEDSIIDLGSGTGKFCIQVFLSTNIKKVIGIELELKKFNISILALNSFSHRIKNERTLNFLNENIYSFDISSYNIIYCCSLCFGEKLLNSIVEKLRFHKNLKYFISTNYIECDFLKIYKKINIKASWSDNEILIIYVLL